jgi:hypothetical protein
LLIESFSRHWNFKYIKLKIMRDSLTKSKEDEKQSISNAPVNKQPETVHSNLEDRSDEAVKMRKFQSEVDGNEETQELSNYQNKISEESNDGVPVEKNDTVVEPKENPVLEQQNTSVEKLPESIQNKKISKSDVLKQQNAAATRLSQPNKNKDKKEKNGDKPKKSTASVETLSQPNQNIIHAGDGEKDGSDAQKNMQIAALLADGGKALGPFRTIFEKLEEVTNASTKEINQQKKVEYDGGHPKVLDQGDTTQKGDIMYHQHTADPIMKPEKSKATRLGGLKGKKRIKQKMDTKYAKAEKNAVNEINDVVRGTLAFENFKEMLKALDIIEKLAGTDFGELTYKIARVKQIYTPISALLYGDVKFNLRVMSGSDYKGDAFDHNCELQLNTIEMLKGKGTKPGHGAYEKWRDLDEDHWANEKTALPLKLRDMTDEDPTKYRSRARLIVNSSHTAYLKADVERQKDKENFNKVVEKVNEIGGNIVEVLPEHLGRETFEKEATNINADYGKYITSNIDILKARK